jgi:GNAT superfamily N-acetyltransferase
MAGAKAERADVEDLAAIGEVLERFFSEEGFELPGEGMQPRLEQYVSLPHHAVFAAREGGRLVGVATVTSNFGLEYGWVAELEDLYVIPEHRGGGVARALVVAAVSWARDETCSALLATVTPEGQDAHDLIGFYRHIGFADEGRKLLELDLRR